MAKTQTKTAAQTAKAPAKAATVLAQVTPEKAKAAAVKTAKAVVTCEKAKRALLGSVAEAVKAIGCPLTAAQYDKQFRDYLVLAFAAEVKRKAITQKTADQYLSKLKTAILAILSKAAVPVAGETFWEFYDRASLALASATIQQGSNKVPVWEAQTKRGPKAGSGKGAGSRKSGGPVPAAVAEANASAATAGAAGQGKSPKEAAALILADGNAELAGQVLAALTSYRTEFRKWIAALTSTDGEAKPQASQPVTLSPQQPATVMAEKIMAARAAKAAKAKAEPQRLAS